MIPEIGLMIGAYIVTRMVAMLGQPSPQSNILAKALAVLTILVAIVCSFDLLLHGLTSTLPR